MQEKINKRRFVLLGVLTLATLFALWWAQPEDHLDVDENIFQVGDLTTISKAEFVSDTNTVTLEFDGGRWRVNDRYNADAGLIRVLFATLQQARPKRAVAKIRQDSVFDQLAESGVKVSLYAGDELKKEFFAGGNSNKTQALFADPTTGEVYVMTIPGYRVYVSGILELHESGWRDKYVFGFNWQNFRKLDVEFPGKSSANFTVSMTKDYFGIEDLGATDTTRLNTFLDNLSLLTADQYITEPKLSDSLRKVTPRAEFRITDIGNRVYSLSLYLSGESPEVFGLIQDSQPALFNRRKIEALLKPKSFFKEK